MTYPDLTYHDLTYPELTSIDLTIPDLTCPDGTSPEVKTKYQLSRLHRTLILHKVAGWSHLSNNATLRPNVQVRTWKTSSWLPSWAECGNKKRRAPNKIYQKEMFYKPRILYMELTHKLRIGDIYHANICLCNICTGYKCHNLRVCATISKMYQFQIIPNLSHLT